LICLIAATSPSSILIFRPTRLRGWATTSASTAASSSSAAASSSAEAIDNPVEAPATNTPVAFLYDVDNDAVLLDKESTTRSYPASTTKVMTALLAIENGELSETATGKTAGQSVLLTLSKTGFFTELAGLMPQLLKLYAALVGQLRGADLLLLCSDTAAPSERLAVLCRALADCAETAAAVDAGLRNFAPWDSADAEKVLDRAGLRAAYADFLERCPAGDLTTLLTAAREGDADAQASAVRSYLRAVCPTLAFLLFQERK